MDYQELLNLHHNILFDNQHIPYYKNQNLRGFKHTETTVKKNQLNQTLKQTTEGKKALNTVYINMKSILQWRKETDTDEVAVQIFTFTVTGDERDIRKELKKFIAFAIKMPYIVKVVILRATVNKDYKDADYQYKEDLNK